MQGAGPSASVAFDSALSTAVLLYDFSYFSTAEGWMTFTVVRTEALRDGIINSVIATGESGAQMCMAKDSVAVKDTVRKRRQHDDDRYTDKRAHGDDDR